MELFQLTAVLLSGGHDIDSGCFYTAMAQNIRKLCDIFTDPIEASGKEFAKIMGKHLSGVHIGSCAKPLHLCPYITAVQRFAPTGNENRALADLSVLREFQKPLF